MNGDGNEYKKKTFVCVSECVVEDAQLSPIDDADRYLWTMWELVMCAQTSLRKEKQRKEWEKFVEWHHSNKLAIQLIQFYFETDHIDEW